MYISLILGIIMLTNISNSNFKGKTYVHFLVNCFKELYLKNNLWMMLSPCIMYASFTL